MANTQCISRLVNILEQSNGLSEDLVFIVDRSHIIQYVGGNLIPRAGCHGRAAESGTIRTFPGCYRLLKPHVQGVMESGKHVSLENSLVIGTRAFWFDTRLSPILDESGRVMAVMGTCRDVTALKRNEQLPVCSGRAALQPADSKPCLLAVVDSQYRLERVNAAMAEKLETSVDGAKGLLCYQHLHGRREPPDFCPLINAPKTGKEYWAEATENHLGHTYFVVVSALAGDSGKSSGCLYLAKGCRNLQAATNGEAEPLNRMRSLVRQVQHIITIHNPQHEYVFFKTIPDNGWVADDILGKSPFDFFELRTASMLALRLQKAFEGASEPAQPLEYAWDGESVWFVLHLTPIRDSAGEIRAVVSFATRIDPPEMAEECPEGYPRTGRVQLTRREREILRLIAAGHTNRQIADHLFISNKTVDTHRTRIMHKLNVHKASALVKYALELRIL